MDENENLIPEYLVTAETEYQDEPDFEPDYDPDLGWMDDLDAWEKNYWRD